MRYTLGGEQVQWEDNGTYRPNRYSCMFIIDEAIDMINKLVTDLERTVKEGTVRREIKELASKIKKQVNTLNMESVLEWGAKQRFEMVEIMKHDVEVQTKGVRMVDSSTQTVDNMKLDLQVTYCLKEGDGLHSLIPLLDKNWPRAVYSDLKDISFEHDTALILNPEQGEGQLPEMISKGMPETKHFVKGGIDPEEVDCLERTTICRSIKGKSLEGGNQVYIIPHVTLEDGKSSIEKMVNLLNKW